MILVPVRVSVPHGLIASLRHARERQEGRQRQSPRRAGWKSRTDGLHHPEGARIIASTSGSISPRSELWRGGLTSQRRRGGGESRCGGGKGPCGGRAGARALWRCAGSPV